MWISPTPQQPPLRSTDTRQSGQDPKPDFFRHRIKSVRQKDASVQFRSEANLQKIVFLSEKKSFKRSCWKFCRKIASSKNRLLIFERSILVSCGGAAPLFQCYSHRDFSIHIERPCQLHHAIMARHRILLIRVEHQLPKIRKKSLYFTKRPSLASNQLSRAYTTWLGGGRSLYVYTMFSMATVL